MAEISDLEPVDADNIARFPEGQLVPTFNNGARALEGILARWFADTNGTIVSTGDAPSYAVATSSTYISLVDGLVVVWRAHASFESGTAKLTINALTQKNLVRQNGTALVPGDIVEDQTVVSRYNSDMDAFECLGIGGSYASNTEAAAGSISTKAVTPANLAGYVPGSLLGILEHQLSSGTDETVSSSWATRPLNTEVYDRLGILSLSSNKFTISEAGSYEIEWESPHFGGGKTRLNNNTGAAVVAYATQGRWPGGTGNTMIYSKGHARVTIAGSTEFEIQNQGGGGLAGSYSVIEVYTRVIIRRG
jgi:hypothetical protein